jgi:hypothetical protein
MAHRSRPVPLRNSAWATLVIAVALGLAPVPAPAAPPPLYHSPGDDGVSGGVPAFVPAGQTVTLHLYLGVGALASAADPCHQGDGDELCGYRLRLTGSGVALQGFTPADPDILWNLAVDQLDLTGGDFQTGDLGPTKLGDLVIQGPGPAGTLDLVVGEFVSTQLVKEQPLSPATIVQLPEPEGSVVLLLGAALLARLRARRERRTRVRCRIPEGSR